MQGMVATKKLFKGRKMSQAKTEAKGFEQVQLPTKSLAALDLPPPPKPVEVIEEEEPVKKERVEKIISDWVLYHKENEERYVKEDKALHRLAELQKRSIQIAPTNLEYRPNPFNKDNHQFVTGKIMTREPSTGKEPPNDTFLSHIRRIHTQPIERNQLPETSNQEIGWFNKVETKCTLRQNPRINHPRRYSDVSSYMDTYWGYYPPEEARYHPKDK